MKIDTRSIKSLQKKLKSVKENIDSVDDYIQPALKALDIIKSIENRIPNIPYKEILDNENILDISEKDLDTKNGLEESVSIELKKQKLEEESVPGGLKVLTKWIDEGGDRKKPDAYEEFLDYATKAGIDTSKIDPSWFNTRSRNIVWANRKNNKSSEKPSSLQKSVVEEPKKVELSKSLQDMIDICNAGSEYVETAADTVAAKYRTIDLKLRRVITGRSLKNYYLLFGDAGIGKSTIVKDTLNDLGYTDVPIIKGDIGRSRTDVARFLWETKDKDIIILDDCDTMIDKTATDKAVQNMLKGAMDPDGHHVTISPTIQKMVSKSISLDENKKKNDDFFRKMLKEDETSEDSEITLENEVEMIPTSWDYNARVIFISNLDTPQVNPAVLSRCDYYCLHLTQEEYLIRLGMIIDKMKIDTTKSGWSEEQVKKSKAVAVMMMSNVIEAANKGVKLFGKTVNLTHPLEFRIVRDLVEGYLILVDDYKDHHPGVSDSEAGTKILPEFVKVILIPKL